MKKYYVVAIAILIVVTFGMILSARGSDGVTAENNNPVPVYAENGALLNNENFPNQLHFPSLDKECSPGSPCTLPVLDDSAPYCNSLDAKDPRKQPGITCKELPSCDNWVYDPAVDPEPPVQGDNCE